MRSGCGGRDRDATADVVVEKERSERLVRTKEGRQIELCTRKEPQGETSVTANGKPVALTDTQRLLIRRHEERIQAILLEAAGDLAGQQQEGQ
jgi:hypothetical protein